MWANIYVYWCMFVYLSVLAYMCVFMCVCKCECVLTCAFGLLHLNICLLLPPDTECRAHMRGKEPPVVELLLDELARCFAEGEERGQNLCHYFQHQQKHEKSFELTPASASVSSSAKSAS